MVTNSFLISETGRDSSSLRKVHRSMALRCLSQQPGIARNELANQLGLSSMAIGRIVRELDEAGLIASDDSPGSSGGRGRPASGLHLRDDGAYVIGAVISAYSQEILLMNLSGQLIDLQSVQVDDVTDGPRVLVTFCKAIKAMIRKAGISAERIAGAGFTVAASVDPLKGKVIDSGYLGWSTFDLAGKAQRALNVPVTVNNIADALLRAEAFAGCATNAKAVVLIHGATTLGASYLYNNELVSGAHSRAGSIGHFPVRPTKLVCSCGRSDCLNCKASGWAILNSLGEINTSSYQQKHVQEYSKKIRSLTDGIRGVSGSAKRLNQTLLKAGRALAHGLRIVELAFDPDLLVLAGPLSEQKSYFQGALEELKSNGRIGSDVARKLKRGSLKPNHAAGVIALLDTVFAPTLDVQRLVCAPALVSKKN